MRAAAGSTNAALTPVYHLLSRAPGVPTPARIRSLQKLAKLS
jgi:hypothetical protein